MFWKAAVSKQLPGPHRTIRLIRDGKLPTTDFLLRFKFCPLCPPMIKILSGLAWHSMCIEARRQLARVSSPLLPCRDSQVLTSGHQTWQRAPLPAQPRQPPQVLFWVGFFPVHFFSVLLTKIFLMSQVPEAVTGNQV